MSRVVWKFPLIGVDCTVPALLRPRSVHVGLDPRGVLCVWVEHEFPQPQRTLGLIPLSFAVVGTGHEIRDGFNQHVGSVAIPADGLVLHVYELGPANGAR